MSDAPLVSVVIPVYNGERFLGEALRSTFAQTYPSFEVIVVDDGSSDASVALARRFESVRIITGPHRGVSSARNEAVAASSGEFVAFLDADDTWYPEKLEGQVEFARLQPHLGVVTALQDYLIEGPVPSWFRGPTDGSSEAGFFPSSWLVRRECWDRVGPFAEHLTHGEDIDWLSRARDLGIEVGTVPRLLLTRRIHNANASGAPSASQRGLFSALRASVDRKRETTS